MKKFPSCDTIIVTNRRARCPMCKAKLPGEFLPDSAVSGYIIQCKSCRKRIRIEYRSDQLRSAEREPRKRPVTSPAGEETGRFLFCLEVIAWGDEN